MAKNSIISLAVQMDKKGETMHKGFPEHLMLDLLAGNRLRQILEMEDQTKIITYDVA